MLKKVFKKWWQSLIYEPGDPKLLAGGKIKITAIGGGTGLSVLLRGLKKYSGSISAVVAVTDDGASSGKLRKEFDVLPPGDIRKCVSALAYNEDLISHILEYRFSGRKKSLSGHTLGNIWITALTKYFGSFAKAVEATSQIFTTAGTIYPATLSKVRIGAEYTSGRRAVGESNVPQPGRKIKRVFLTKKNIRAYNKAVESILKADLIVIGPGSLYTSIIPNLLIPGIRKAIIKNKGAVKIFVVNCSTERGETEGYGVADHIEAIFDHAGRVFNLCLVNRKMIKRSDKFSKLGKINNITTKEDELLGCKIIHSDIVSRKYPLFHDQNQLALSLINVYQSHK